ncbi:uncharacterized protein LOC118190731 [Stegodyphus dumicola]|uniref:uncharacterized protein LOC118190731 n=1 Tax=Stegodyphus dumicola TaxID=202533 RepID=UPI0015B151BC|nr:uncharacterized protein LOC118190731 [Stegodyphus dumicola]
MKRAARTIRYIHFNIASDTRISIFKRYKLPGNKLRILNKAFSLTLQQEEQELSQYKSPNDLNTYTERLLDTLRSICDQHLPTRAAKRLQGISWWTKELRQQRQKCRALRRRLRTNINETTKNAILATFREERAHYKNNILKAKITSWRKFCTENNNPYGILHKLATNKVFKPDQLYAQIANQPITTHIAESTAATTLNTVFPADDPDDDTPEQRHTRGNTTIPETSDDEPFEMEEIKQIFRQLPVKKAPGPDGLDYAIIKVAFNARPTYFKALFNKLLQLSNLPYCIQTRTGLPVFKKA